MDKLLGMEIVVHESPHLPQNKIHILVPRQITDSERQEMLHELVAKLNTLYRGGELLL